MEKYHAKASKYEVFGANMIVDTKEDTYVNSNTTACKPCQCHCRTCLGGMAPDIEKITCEKDIEKALELLLAA